MYEKSQSAYNINSYAADDSDSESQEESCRNGGNKLSKSVSMGNCVVEKKRGFKPSDRLNPAKKQFLIELSKQIWQKKHESSNATKHIDLRKIFTPASDTEEILPRNRKLYASSAFYSPGLHPTVEDQVELARRISNSLSDISNQKSKGQSMYVNRKKRSVKWVHEGSGQDSSVQEKNYQEEFKENNLALGETTSTTQNSSTPIQVPLRLLMNPRGKVRDITSVGDSFNIEASLLSPDKCAELVTALQTQKGKGAELFAKRRRKSEKWVVDETNTGTQSPSGLPDYHQHQQVKPPTSPSILPAYSDAGKHRVQLNLHQEQVLEKYVKPGLKVIKTPWEAALETGSASSAFVEDVKLTPHHTPTPTLSPKPAPQYQFAGSTVPDAVSYNDGYTTDYNITPSHKLHEACFPTCKPNFSSNPQRDLAYKPSLPQGWKAPSVTLPKELYLPKEISLESYAPPPVVNIKQPEAYNKPSWKFTPTPSPVPSISFPLAKPNSGGGVGFLSYGATPPPKQQYYEPTSYRTVPQSTTPNVTQISYNPSPLSYEKIAKFENVAEQQLETNDWNSQPRRLGIQSQGANVRNASPAQFGERSGSAGDHLSSSSSPYQTHNVPRNDIYERATTPIYTKRQNINKLLHGQNYNNTARGWRASSSASSVGSYPKACGGAYNTGLGAGGYGGGYQQKPLATANDLPYTDF
ncbi:PREDICTED: uncharacterized protein LOC108380860 isoform X5 [Rhagoletis zephyria]|uniref:uncharacterized protein LOC108380860 isoform X5 n=1 Tax=Rhagoletis zephyria TaxID=28612 RepID=UPI000811A603|nr:PREDICTED: uncharacterized protein LOC108380860 isoform X5 [Rhagoletis zephyria]